MSEHEGSEDLDSVRAERDRLKEEVDKLEAKPQKRARLRRVFAVVFVVLAVLAASAMTPGVWARRTIYNTDRYVATVGPLASDPAIQEALARQLTVSVFTELDIQTKLEAAIAERAPKLEFIAGSITSSLQGFVQDQVQKILASDRFRQTWIAANTVLHRQLVAVLDGSHDVLTVQGNQVVFNYLPLVNDALAQLSGTLSDILNRTITLPTITADMVPSQAVATLGTALGVSLPPTFGSVTLFQSDQLTSIQDAVSTVNNLLLLSIVLFVVGVVLALVLSTNRRRTLLQLLTALIVVVVLERRFAIAEANNVVDLAKPENQAAVQAIIDAFLGSLLLATKRILWVLFVVLVVAVFTGPYPWAVRFRGWVDNLTAIIDVNRLGQRGETMVGWDLDTYVSRAEAFGWNAIALDGHDLDAIDTALGQAVATTGRPTVLVARTMKGKGVAAVENQNGFHGKPMDDPDAAIAELGGLTDVRVEIAKPEGLAPERPMAAMLELPRYELGTEVATRKAYGDALAAFGAARPDVVVLDGEVSNSTFAESFAKAHPERYFEMYIAEQQLVAAAVGLQAVGWRPFASTFAAFLSRAYDFVRMAAISRATFSLCGSHAGVSIGEDGPSQMALEDIASLRAIHGSTVLHPCDANQTAKLVAAMADTRRDLVSPHAQAGYSRALLA